MRRAATLGNLERCARKPRAAHSALTSVRHVARAHYGTLDYAPREQGLTDCQRSRANNSQEIAGVAVADADARQPSRRLGRSARILQRKPAKVYSPSVMSSAAATCGRDPLDNARSAQLCKKRGLRLLGVPCRWSHLGRTCSSRERRGARNPLCGPIAKHDGSTPLLPLSSRCRTLDQASATRQIRTPRTERPPVPWRCDRLDT